MKYERDNGVMVSFDVESLFTNVPIQDAVQVALRNLVNDRGLPDHTNLCECGKVYIEKTGIAMRERCKNMTETRGLLVRKSAQFLRPGAFSCPFGTKSRLMIVTRWCIERVKEAIHI